MSIEETVQAGPPVRPPEQPARPPAPEQPALSQEFYAKLLHLPTCKTQGYCSNCGRCEH